MPKGRGIGVSARIEAEDERRRLREAVGLFATARRAGGYIVRTAAEGASLEAMRADMLFLKRLWEAIRDKGLRAQCRTTGARGPAAAGAGVARSAQSRASDG